MGRQGPEARQLRSTALPAGCALGPQSGSQPPSSVRPRGGHHRDPVCGEQGTNKTGRPSSTPTQNSSLLVGTAQSEAKFSGHSEAPVTGLQAKAGQPPEGRAGSGTPAMPSETSVSRGPQSPQPDLTAPASQAASQGSWGPWDRPGERPTPPLLLPSCHALADSPPTSRRTTGNQACHSACAFLPVPPEHSAHTISWAFLGHYPRQNINSIRERFVSILPRVSAPALREMLSIRMLRKHWLKKRVDSKQHRSASQVTT